MDVIGWQLAVECLADELEYLEAVPEQVIVVEKYVKRCFGLNGPLHKSGELRTNWRTSQQHARLDRLLTLIEEALALPDKCVCFWTTPGFKGQIERALKTTPQHDTNLYVPGLL
jgi:hypothetical protein